MKKLLVITAAALLTATPASAWWWDNYGSKYEAQKACSTWLDEGPKYTVEIEDLLRFDPGNITYDSEVEYKVITQTARRCRYEMATRQFLGEQNMCVKDGDDFKRDTSPEVCNEIKRRFKY